MNSFREVVEFVGFISLMLIIVGSIAAAGIYLVERFVEEPQRKHEFLLTCSTGVVFDMDQCEDIYEATKALTK